MNPLAEARGLTKLYPLRQGLFGRKHGAVKALGGVDLQVYSRECLALVGESGSGKTTLGRCLLRLLEPTSGQVFFAGEELTGLDPEELRRRRRRFQMVFQDPYGSLNPRMRIRTLLEEPLAVHKLVPRGERRERATQLLAMVGLEADALDRFPHQFSGGQRQRIGIARALSTAPELIVADEPVSALDVSVRAQIVNLLYRLQRQLGLTLLFISHDLALMEQIADRVVVLYLGGVVEVCDARRLSAEALHPYTVSLLSAVPVPDPVRTRRRILLPGDPPSPTAPPPGCTFHPRCPVARERCRVETPVLTPAAHGGQVACFHPGDLALATEPARAGTNATQSRTDG